MDSYKGKRKSEKDVKESRKSKPHHGKKNLHLDKQEKESIPKSKSGLTSSEFIALKERGLQVLDEKIKKGLTEPDNYSSGFFMGDPEIPSESRGLGDTIAKITKAKDFLKTAS